MNTGFTFRRSLPEKALRLVCLAAFSLAYLPLSAQVAAAPAAAAPPVAAPSHSLFDSPLFVTLFCVSLLLIVVILVLAQVAKAAIHVKSEQEKKNNAGNGTVRSLIVLLLAGGLAVPATAQEAVSVAAPVVKEASDYWGMDGTTFYLLVIIIGFELLAILQLYSVAMDQLGVRQRREELAAAKKKQKALVKQPSFLEKMNRSVAIEKETDITLDHDYDGIKELDNNLPPWWKYGFYATIVFAVVYLVHYHVTHTGKLQLAEYEQQVRQAEYDLAAYRKKAANRVDENNATLLTDAGALASGKAIFNANCAACHGTAGEGGVGPNLTDDYWLHEGGIKDVFKTIKYGYPELGMKSWQQDLGARQIHEVASYVKTLRGTNPPNAKEQQGELYKEAADTTGSN